MTVTENPQQASHHRTSSTSTSTSTSTRTRTRTRRAYHSIIFRDGKRHTETSALLTDPFWRARTTGWRLPFRHTTLLAPALVRRLSTSFHSPHTALGWVWCSQPDPRKFHPPPALLGLSPSWSPAGPLSAVSTFPTSHNICIGCQQVKGQGNVNSGGRSRPRSSFGHLSTLSKFFYLFIYTTSSISPYSPILLT